MASWQSILAVGGVGLFVWWFLNKGGCQGDGGLTGEGTPLCYTGPDVFAFLKGGGEDAPEEPENDAGVNPDEDAPDKVMADAQRELAGTKDRDASGKPIGITPAAKKAHWANSYMIQNSITVA